jgi:hypothetical protein
MEGSKEGRKEKMERMEGEWKENGRKYIVTLYINYII